MSGAGRLILLLALATAPGLAAAQSNVVAPPPPPRPGTVGPEQLRDFSLGGTREPAPAPAETAPTRPAPAVTTPVTRTPAPAEARRSAPAAERAAPAGGEAAPTRPSEAVTVGLPREPEAAAPVTQAPAFFPPATPAPLPEPTPSPASPPSETADEASGGTGTWLAVLAFLAALGAAAFWWLRRSRAETDGQGFGQLAFAGAPAPATTTRPAPQPPVAAPAPAPKPASVGIVSSRLRAWLEMEIGVRAAAVTDEELQLEVDILLTNSGSAPAREIAVEALVLNAGPEQEAEIARFYARPDADGHAPDVVPPLGQLALSTTLRMPRAAFREYAAGDAKVMVPVVVLNAGYKAGSAQGRTSAAFLVGRAGTQTGKLGPLPTDQGAKGFTRIAARRLAEGIRR